VDSELTTVNEEQLRANRFDLVSRLADDLAHEIKNPLNSIVINLEVLKVRIGRGDPDAALERAGVIETETRRLHLMIDRLLQLLRPERDESNGFALDHVLDDLLPLVEVRARLAGNTFTTAGDAALIVLMRRDVFKFTLLNLLTAVHDRLGDNGGTLSLVCAPDQSASRIRITILGEPTTPPLAPADARYERAMAVTAALVEPFRGTLEAAPNGVTVFLPRADGA
jgi:signal transduction histidine kinase